MADKYQVENLNLYYGNFQALKDINLNIKEKEITAFIGPSGCGKSTFIKTLNRMNDLVAGCKLRERFFLTARIFSERWMCVRSEKESAWYSRNRIRSR